MFVGQVQEKADVVSLQGKSFFLVIEQSQGNGSKCPANKWCLLY